MREVETLMGSGLTPNYDLVKYVPLEAACVAGRDAMGKFLVLLVDNQGTEGVHGKDHGKAAHMPPA